MKIFKLIIALMTVLVISGLQLKAQTAAADSGRGRLTVVGGDTYDWGNVPPGSLKTTLEVKNTGDGTLNITSVVPSCGCTTAPIDKNSLAPGESAHITISVDVSSKQGRVEKLITLNSDDTTNRARMVHLVATIKRDYVITPAPYVLLNEARANEETVQTLRLQNTGDEPLSISAPTFVDGNVKIRFESTEKMTVPVGGEAKLTYYITPQPAKQAPDGSTDYGMHGTIHYTTSSAATKDLDIKIYGSMIPPVQPAPQAAPPATPQVTKNH